MLSTVKRICTWLFRGDVQEVLEWRNDLETGFWLNEIFHGVGPSIVSCNA